LAVLALGNPKPQMAQGLASLALGRSQARALTWGHPALELPALLRGHTRVPRDSVAGLPYSQD